MEKRDITRRYFLKVSAGVTVGFMTVPFIGCSGGSGDPQGLHIPLVHIIHQPLDDIVASGAAVRFTVSVSGGSSPYAYQWYKNGEAIADAKSATCAYTVGAGDNGAMFSVRVTDAAGAKLMSNAAVLFLSGSGIHEKRVYIVATAHLDLQWLWTLKTTINEYLPNTLHMNFSLMEKYPGYRFNFEGAYRYMLMKKYYPSDYQKLKGYVAKGQWLPAGSMIEAADVNIPSPEALIRQVLYGNQFFRQEFGFSCEDIFLPDCFGFGFALPTIAAHCGLKGFSTQKFEYYGGFVPTPFSIGRWKGVDGSEIVAALKPGPYSSSWEIRQGDLNDLGAATGVYAAYDYFGTGDQGGAPAEYDVSSLIDRMEQNRSEDVKVYCTESDQLFKDITPQEFQKLPAYQGELLLTTHGTGVYSAHADLKLLNRSNELMAVSAERALVAAELFGGLPYPGEQVRTTWINFLCHSFHDDLCGTSIPSAYTDFTIPDYTNALATFTNLRNQANNALAGCLDTRVGDPGAAVPVVVYNPAATSREDIVDTTITLPGTSASAVRVYDPEGAEVPSQVVSISGQSVRVLFMVQISSLGYKVYEVRKASSGCALSTGLGISVNQLENNRYIIAINAEGDVSSIYDKALQKELLAAPSRFELRNDQSKIFPAWELLYKDVVSTPRAYVDESVQKIIVQNGPALVTLRVTRTKEGSSYTHDYSLCANSDGYFQINNSVNWCPSNSYGSLLKVGFPLTVRNAAATYDLGLGTIARGGDSASLYEVPAQQWADITHADGSYGVAILNNCKYGWNKPSDNKLQLTLIHSPAPGGLFCYEGDVYTHTFVYAIFGHAGDWADGGVVAAAERLNQPLMGFQVSAHDGLKGKEIALVRMDSTQVTLMALKKAEAGQGYIVRVRETAGKNWSNVSVRFAAAISSAQEVSGQEDSKNSVSYSGDTITFDIGPYQPKSFWVTARIRTKLGNKPNVDSILVSPHAAI